MTSTRERIESILAESSDLDLGSADIAAALVDKDVAAGEYEGCSSELESWYLEYEATATQVLASRRAT